MLAKTGALVWSLLNSLLLDSCWSPSWCRSAGFINKGLGLCAATPV